MVGAVTMLLRETELLATTLEVMGLGAPWLVLWVPMWPWSWVGVLQWTPHNWQTRMPPEVVPPKPPGLSFHSWPWCFWAWTRRYVSVVKPAAEPGVISEENTRKIKLWNTLMEVWCRIMTVINLTLFTCSLHKNWEQGCKNHSVWKYELYCCWYFYT